MTVRIEVERALYKAGIFEEFKSLLDISSFLLFNKGLHIDITSSGKDNYKYRINKLVDCQWVEGTQIVPGRLLFVDTLEEAILEALKITATNNPTVDYVINDLLDTLDEEYKNQIQTKEHYLSTSDKGAIHVCDIKIGVIREIVEYIEELKKKVCE